MIAGIAACLRDQDVSLEALLQRGRNPGDSVPIVLTSRVRTSDITRDKARLATTFYQYERAKKEGSLSPSA